MGQIEGNRDSKGDDKEINAGNFSNSLISISVEALVYWLIYGVLEKKMSFGPILHHSHYRAKQSEI